MSDLFASDLPTHGAHTAVDETAPLAERLRPHSLIEVIGQKHLLAPPQGAQLKVPAGFAIKQFASGLEKPRLMRVAPNGDIFVAESSSGRIRVLRPTPDGEGVAENKVFASGLRQPFGIAFYPAENPQWVYIANTDSVVRFAYKAGDMEASGPAEMTMDGLSGG